MVILPLVIFFGSDVAVTGKALGFRCFLDLQTFEA
jgi:hypothetical protein